MNRDIKYIRYIKKLNYEWSINDKKITLTYFTSSDLDKLLIFTNQLEKRLIEKKPLITSEDTTQYGKVWSIPNALELSAIVFPQLTSKYVKYFIEILIEKDRDFGNARIFKLIVGRDQGKGKFAFPTFLSILHDEQIRKMKELGMFKYAFNEKKQNNYDIEYIKKDTKNPTTWRIDGKSINLKSFREEDVGLINNICYEVQKRLENNNPMLGGRCTCYPKKMGKKNIALIAGDIFTDLTEQYIKQFIEKMAHEREMVGLTYFYSTVFSYDDMRRGYELNDSSLDTMLRKDIEEYSALYIEEFIQSNFQEGIKGDLWKLYEKTEGNGYNYVTLDFSSIRKPLLKAEIKAFIKDELIDSENYGYVAYTLRKLQVGFAYILSNFDQVDSSADIDVNMVVGLRNYLQTDATKYNSNERLGVSTQAKIMQSFKKLFSYLINTDELAIVKPKTNPFILVSYHNLENMEKRTEPIPDEIIKEILRHIDDIEPIYQRVLLISLNTGLRFKEIEYLEENSLSYDEENKAWKLEYIPWKILNARRQKNLGDYAFVVIQDFLAQEIKEQIRETKDFRITLNTDKIFIREGRELKVGKGTVSTITSGGFNNAINKIIKKHHIIDGHGELWKFTHKQCRKTLAVDMITSGMSSQEIAYQF